MKYQQDGARDKTMGDKQIEATMAKIQKILETQLDAKIRG